VRQFIKVAFVLLIFSGMLFVSMIDTLAMNLEMDESLKNADASFIGEDADDYSGYRVAGAGDVNGDGYDDILIGAWYDEEGGYRAGQVYLVFGSASGLAMDTSLSNADASFIGEKSYDRAGYAVAGAGDVNGDGFDDILIGARFNDEGAKEAGQVYLILGKSSGWAMDTDLSSVDASFIGEEEDDESGTSVTGAGDVNKDGFDDLLIGAIGNGEGGKNAGQVYLMLGKSSGWSMDTDLSQADASFIGPFKGALCGFSVAGAGDVNGDDVDDILIGGYGGQHINEDMIGRTYIVFGKKSGWVSDFNLSNANASYVGQTRRDFSAWSVAGAGDVNDDGFDDILIGAPERDSTGTNAGEAYLVLGMASGWKLNVSLSNADASFWGEAGPDIAGRRVAGAGDVNGDGYDDFLIGAPSNSESGSASGQSYLVLGRSYGWDMNTSLADVDASFLGEAQGDRSGWSLTGAGDVNGDGYSDLLIGAFGNEFYTGQTYLVYGKATPPRIQKDSTFGIATTGDPFSFNVSVSSSYDISVVSVEFWYGNTGAHSNLPASLEKGNVTRGTWLLNITIPSDSVDTLHYIVHISDGTFTTDTNMYNVSVWDNDPPLLADDMTLSTATTGDDLVFSVNATDNIELADVWVEYWFGDSPTHFNDSMSNPTDDLWNLTIALPPDSLETLHYRFYALDTTGNNAMTQARNVTVLDDDPPIFEIDDTPDNATTGDVFTFTVHVNDNVLVDSVNVTYWYGISGASTNISMLEGLVGTWTLSILVPMDSLDPLHYLFSAIDNSTNIGVSISKEVTVRDDDSPVFGEDIPTGNGTTGDDLNFSVNVSDNIGVSGVFIVYWMDGSEEINSSLTDMTSNKWSIPITIPFDRDGKLYYRFAARDGSDNWAMTPTRNITVVDNDGPVFIQDMTPSSGTTGDDLSVAVSVSDNLGVAGVTVTYWFGDEGAKNTVALQNENGIIWVYTIPIPADMIENLNYQVIAFDASGNENSTQGRSVQIHDNDAPVIGADLTSETIVKGLIHTFEVEVDDNLGVASVHLEYWFGDGDHVNVSSAGESHLFEMNIPRHPNGDVHYIFSASDGAGNWALTEVVTRAPINMPPEMAEIPTWSITEEQESTLDLEPYMSDGNDELTNLSVICDDATVVIEEFILKVKYDIAIPDWTILITVSDGEDRTEVDVHMHIENVNDVPVINSVLPSNGSKYRTGETIVFKVIASDEDNDELSFKWLTEDGQFGTGFELEYSLLSSGKHVITIRVSDGTVTMEETLIVHVIGDVDNGNNNAIIIVLIIVIIGIVLILYFNRYYQKRD